LSFLTRIFGDRREREPLRPLYDAVVGEARNPAWYRDGGVPDTVDGRFDMVAAVLALVLLRLERDGDSAAREVRILTETFVADMDASLRELGTGDLIVGKRVTKLMGALGGRLGAFRAAFAGEGELAAAVRRNIFRESPPSEAAVAWVAERLEALHARLEAAPLAAVLAGEAM
jgi:cytochrome b pre-mRNA-processing protein 3